VAKDSKSSLPKANTESIYVNIYLQKEYWGTKMEKELEQWVTNTLCSNVVYPIKTEVKDAYIRVDLLVNSKEERKALKKVIKGNI